MGDLVPKRAGRRPGRWFDRFGIEQTELDAIIPPQPDLLTGFVTAAIAPFYDATLDARVRQARLAWLADAQRRLEDQIGDPNLRPRCEQVAEMRAEMQDLVAGVQVDVNGFDPLDIEIPEAQLDGSPGGEPLCSSEWSFAEQTRRLIDAKHYIEA